ncbi:MAG: hypothetical protein ACLP01_26400 [Solirubrobacteraceae bacterium]
MATVDTLPDDQRAVLSLVLQRARSYEQIATTLSIERAIVRARALAALDALGGSSTLDETRRAELGDYLLGQISVQAADHVRVALTASDAEHEWARGVATALAPLSGAPLAAIPPPPRPPGSRRGGAVLLAACAGIGVAALVAILVVLGSGSSTAQQGVLAARPQARHRAAANNPRRGSGATSGTPSANGTGSTGAADPAGATTTASTTTPDVVAQINLTSSDAGAPAAVGVAQVVRAGSSTGIVIYAQGVPANPAHEFYAVWLSNTPSDSDLLGFLPQRVTGTGKLEADAILPADAARYSTLLITLESQSHPAQPGRGVLAGPFKLPR